MKRKQLLLIIILTVLLIYLCSLITYSQTNIETHLNFRNAKIDTVFDWYASTQLIQKLDSGKYEIKLKGSLERDNGVFYYSYNGKVSCKYAHLEYLYDTEIDIELYNVTGYYPYKIFKAGIDISKSKEYKLNAYFAIKWKYVFAEIVFWDEIQRIKYEFNPKYELTDKLKLGFKIGGIFINNKHKWKSGLTFNYTI